MNEIWKRPILVDIMKLMNELIGKVVKDICRCWFNYDYQFYIKKQLLNIYFEIKDIRIYL